MSRNLWPDSIQNEPLKFAIVTYLASGVGSQVRIFERWIVGRVRN